jgi:hypothetical protein
MGDASLWNRILRGSTSAWRTLEALVGPEPDPDTDVHTKLTFRAVADAVVPETPELADELGSEHVPGGTNVGLGDFLVVYVDDLFQFGLPRVGIRGNLPLAGPVADLIDAAALALLERGENEDDPSHERVVALLDPTDGDPAASAEAMGTFATLSRRDRLRALGRLEGFELELRAFDGELFEFDAGLVGQLVVGFTEMIYYSEWQGYDGFVRSPDELTHSNDPTTVQSWRQTGYPGTAPGYAALRGYLGAEGSTLGDGETWTTIDDGPPSVRLTRGSGSFRENDYDTSGYEELFPEVA